MMYNATITQKGQVTIPVDIRRFLGVKSYEKVTFIKNTDHVIIKPAKSFLDLKGAIKTTKKLSDRSMDKAVLKYFKSQYGKK